MDIIPISTARSIGEKSGALRVAIVAVDDRGYYTATSWGRTRSDCRAMKGVLESESTERFAVRMINAEDE